MCTERTLSESMVRLAYQLRGRLEEVEEGVVEEVEVAGGVDVGEARHLGGEVGLAGAGAEQTAQQAVLHVHLVDAALDLELDIADVRHVVRGVLGGAVEVAR